jgi:uncharacterized protein
MPSARNRDLPPGPVLPDGEAVKPGEQLCLACGLCCDGSLFDHVQLGTNDDAKKLKSLGLPVSLTRSAAPIARFRQPCSALCQDRTCQLYANRPLQCRVFECRVFKDAHAGRIEFSAALRSVKQARQRVENVRRLLRELGDNDEHRSLKERFRGTQRRMESGTAGEAAAHTFAELSLAMHTLNLLAFEKFYTTADDR